MGLGGANKEDLTLCFKIMDGVVTNQRLLKCTHEEADDRLLCHANHAVGFDNFKTIIIASPDPDVFVNAIFHYTRWMFSNLEELWIISGKKGAQQAFPVHQLIEKLDGNIIDILPAVHALTGTS